MDKSPALPSQLLPVDFDGQPPPLAVYACASNRSRGRRYAEAPSATRTAFQRDRDRIIHSAGFRRLKNKTQVIIGREGDYFRTRLTHSLEVAQITRSITRVLALNEDLGEALALAHDLGHTPFGHAGEDALSAALASYGGFSHNDQSFRIVTLLEQQYAAFDGLNLSWEMLEGLVKHNGPLLPLASGKVTPETILAFDRDWPLELDRHAALEAQIAAIADDIAYNTHDADDGWRARLFTLDELADVPLIGRGLADARRQWPDAPDARQLNEAIRSTIGALVADVVAVVRDNIAVLKPKSADDIRAAGRTLAHFSPKMAEEEKILRRFLFTHMYRHASVNRMTSKARRIVRDLFDLFMAEPNCLPTDWHEAAMRKNHMDGGKLQARTIADYIAGMTDRFAITEHRRLFAVEWPD